MKSNQVVLGSEYDRATRTALLLQLPVALIALASLDGGQLAKVCGVAFLGFWLGAALIAVRRPFSPTRWDLSYWRWGSIPALILVAILKASIPL
jgi:hypothetical protein